MRWHKINEWTWISECEDKIQFSDDYLDYTAYPQYGPQVGMLPIIKGFKSLKEAKNYVNNETGWCK